MAVFRSLKHMHVNVVDDTLGNGKILLCMTTKQAPILKMIREETGAELWKEKTESIEAAEILGRELAKKCLEQNITQIVFDRGGFHYTGRVQALAEACRSGGVQF